MTVSYRPGPLSLIVIGDLVFLTPDRALARRVWAGAFGGGRTADLLLDLVRDGFAAVPEFVLAQASGTGARVLARGSAQVAVGTADGIHAWTGQGVTTWAERVFEQVVSVRVGVGGDDGQDLLPIVEGMVLCSAFEYRGEFRDRGQREAALAPEPVADPAPAAEPDPPEAAVPAVPDLAQTRTDDADEGFDHLFESTVLRSVEDAAIREVVEDVPSVPEIVVPEIVVPGIVVPGIVVPGIVEVAATRDFVDDAGGRSAASGKLGDHDGYTITAGDLRALRGRQPSSADTVVPSSPPAAHLELSTGDVVALDRDVVVGRRPQVDRVQGGQVPTVVTVPSPQQDVSRTHVRIGWSGGRFMATDLDSMNGTVLICLDGTHRSLVGGVAQPLSPGDVLDIGDGITLTLRESAS